MQVLVLQFVDPRPGEPKPEFSHCLGVLAAMLDEDGFSLALTAVGRPDPDRLHNAIIEHRPRYVLAELGPHTAGAARRTIAEVAQRFALPVAVFGPSATAQPERTISMPGVRAVAIGEYEHTLLELLQAARAEADPGGIEGLWVKTADGLIRGPARDLHEDLDALPFPDRALFDYERTITATGQASFKAARGCPHWCGTCLNDWYLDLYEGRGTIVRRRGVEDLLDEIDQVRSFYAGVREIQFYDHCFAMDAEWLAAFATVYPKRCGLPFRCHVRLQRVTPEIAKTLADAGCRWVHTAIGSGSRFIREEIQSMHVLDEQVVAAVRTLHDAGLRVAAEVLVGCPYESDITLEDTLQLLRDAAPDEVHPRVYTPTPGTRAADLCAENGWISGRGEENFWAQRSVLDMQGFPARKIDQTVQKFHSLLKHQKRTGLRDLLHRTLWARKPRVSDAPDGS